MFPPGLVRIYAPVKDSRALDRAQVVKTTAHEFGHLWGMGHDPFGMNPCTPPQWEGPYIMIATSTKWERLHENTRRFSTCSKEGVLFNLDLLNRGRVLVSNRCFKPPAGLDDNPNAYCGDGVVNADGEECDCGKEKLCEMRDPKGCCDWRSGCGCYKQFITIPHPSLQVQTRLRMLLRRRLLLLRL